ncbi:MAG: tRNA pseudouridine(55) synthase TruB [Candidatus Omnitrophica bacterium]|nr:tRNA pseudouridine(55) synthase TruB [Candidatus Omnitrophota bacterium]
MTGLLTVDKPQDWTSHDVVAFVKRRYNFKKVGHAGTLDPMATGVLVLLLEKGTKLSQKFINDDKDYQGSLVLGVETDTGDAQGKVVSKQEVPQVGLEDIKALFKEFEGEQQQRPHPVSAVKHKGTRLYKLARKGIVIKPEPRTIHINKLNLINLELPIVWFKVSCSKGTYIRSLAVDIGRKLGTCAHVNSLRRTRSGPFNQEDCLEIDQIKGMELEQIIEKSTLLMKKAKIN